MRLTNCVRPVQYGHLSSHERISLIAALRHRLEPADDHPVGPASMVGPSDLPSARLGSPRLSDVLAQRRLPGLDGLRAIGVLAVVVAHATFTRGMPGDF